MLCLPLDDLPDLVDRPDRHRALADDQFLAVHKSGDLPDDLQHAGQVRGAVLRLWRRETKEDDVAVVDGHLQRTRELEPPFVSILLDHLLQAGLVDRNHALLERLDFLLVDVHADDLIARVGEARALHQTDVASTDNREFH